MKKLRKFLWTKLTPKGGVTVYIPAGAMFDDERSDRQYIQMDDGLRLYFEDGKYVGFSTQMPCDI